MKQHILTFAGLTVLLTGCASTGTIQSTDPGAKISGTMQRGLFESHTIEIILNGKIYRGKWRSDYPTPDQKAATTYPHKKHINQLFFDLKADDGSVMACQGATHVLTGNVTCTADGKEYPVVLK